MRITEDDLVARRTHEASSVAQCIHHWIDRPTPCADPVIFFLIFSKPHNSSLGFYVSEICVSWKMAHLRIEPTKPAPELNALTTRLTPRAVLKQ